MLPDNLSILETIFTKSAEDSQAGTIYVPDDSVRGNRTSFSVRRVSKDTQPFVRFLVSYKTPAKTVNNNTVPATYNDIPGQFIVVNTTITIPNAHVVPVGDHIDPCIKAVGASGLVMLSIAPDPEDTTLSTFGNLLLAGHQ